MLSFSEKVNSLRIYLGIPEEVAVGALISDLSSKMGVDPTNKSWPEIVDEVISIIGFSYGVTPLTASSGQGSSSAGQAVPEPEPAPTPAAKESDPERAPPQTSKKRKAKATDAAPFSQQSLFNYGMSKVTPKLELREQRKRAAEGEDYVPGEIVHQLAQDKTAVSQPAAKRCTPPPRPRLAHHLAQLPLCASPTASPCWHLAPLSSPLSRS